MHPAKPIELKSQQFSSRFSLIKQAKDLVNKGFVIICDDLSLWDELQQSVATKKINLAADWILTLYTFASDRNLINAIELLRHPLLRDIDETYPKAVLDWEYALRQSQTKSFNTSLPQHSLALKMVDITTKNFQQVFQEIIQYLPAETQNNLSSITKYMEFLDGSPLCLEWFKGVLKLENQFPQIRLGIHEALSFKPNYVVFCLKHDQIRSLQTQLLVKKTTWENLKIDDKSFLHLINHWKKDSPINILAYPQEETFTHPLLGDDSIETIEIKALNAAYQKPIANPPLSSRPRSISATGFELLMQDPYGFYARYILKLRPLERTASEYFAKEFGISVHKAIEIFLKQGMDVALKYIQGLELSAHRILWYPRLERILIWISSQIKELKGNKVESEESFKSVLAPSNPITLNARIDLCANTPKGNLVVNFKTGTPPSRADVINGFAPQLAIELFLKALTCPSISTQAEFWQLKGTKPAGVVGVSTAINLLDLQGEIEKIILYYLNKQTPFLTCPWPSKTPRCSDYKILERSE